MAFNRRRSNGFEFIPCGGPLQFPSNLAAESFATSLDIFATVFDDMPKTFEGNSAECIREFLNTFLPVTEQHTVLVEISAEACQ